MQWASWSDFFNMGGFGLYVWGSYGISFLLLGIEVLMLWQRGRNLSKRQNGTPAPADAQLNTSLQGVQ